jgi:UDP-GlcNAc:undecaprenyl-phosphate/decaprenyl-phosphate GlcNAc-1-phosphate transferase
MTDVALIAAVFGGALALSLLGIILLRRFWTGGPGFDSGDGHRKQQQKPLLRLGGVVFYLVFVLGYLLSNHDHDIGHARLSTGFLAWGTVIFVLGFLDDLYRVSAPIKLIVQLFVAVGAYSGGMRIELLSIPWAEGTFDLGAFGLLATVLWFVAIPNLINLIDGLDGLAGGVGLFLAINLALLGYLSGNDPLMLLSVAMIGGLIGFLIFNLPPAKIYMGDGGAYLLGYYIAATSLVSSNKGSVFGALLVVVIGLGFPILDTLFSMTRRSMSGLPIMRPDARHLHHRLLTLGFSKRTIILVLYGIFAGLSLVGLAVYVIGGYVLPVFGMVLTVALLGAVGKFGMVRTVEGLKSRTRGMLRARKDVRYALLMAQVLEHDLDRVVSDDAYWERFHEFLGRFGICTPGSAELVLGKVSQERPEGGPRETISLPLADGWHWILDCPHHPDGVKRWERILRCFVPVLMSGIARWGNYPKCLGVIKIEVEGRELCHVPEPKAGFTGKLLSEF